MSVGGSDSAQEPLIIDVAIPASAWSYSAYNYHIAAGEKINNEDLTNIVKKYPCVIDCLIDFNINEAIHSQNTKILFAQYDGPGKYNFYSYGNIPKIPLVLKCKVTPVPEFTVPQTKYLSSLSVGETIEIPVLEPYQSRFGKSIVWKVADKNHAGYPTNSVTLITDKIIQIMAFDAKEPSNSDTGRKNNGNNRYSYSNIRQWLNSTKSANYWYTANHSSDNAPATKETDVTYNPYKSWPGFLHMINPVFVNNLLPTTITISKTDADGGGSETVTDKMFLPSLDEMSLPNSNNFKEGSQLKLFTDSNSRLAYPTPECVSNSDGYETENLKTSKAWNWWLRTPVKVYSYSTHNINTLGDRANQTDSDGIIGLRPLCNLPNISLISYNKNQNGNYEFLGINATSIGGSAIVPSL